MKLKLTQLITAVSFCLITLLVCGCSATKPNNYKTSLGSETLTTPPLRIGVSANAPPHAYKLRGNLHGLEIDFAKQLGKYLSRDIKFVELRWDKQLSALEEGDIDIIMSGMTATPKRAYRVAFSQPYMRTGQMLLVRMDEAGKYGQGIYSLMGSKPKIGTIENTTGDYFITKTIHGADIVRYKKSETAVKDLVIGKIDVFLHDAPIICHFAARGEQQKLTPILQFATEEFLAWPVNKMDRELLGQVNDFIAVKQQDGSLQNTIKHWIPNLWSKGPGGEPSLYRPK